MLFSMKADRDCPMRDAHKEILKFRFRRSTLNASIVQSTSFRYELIQKNLKKIEKRCKLIVSFN
jgi:hypothetical protein